ncbi:MAG: hypothetical protein WCJ95_19380 [Mariniphaga sp.]
MSTPDKELTASSYLMNLSYINLLIETGLGLPEEKVLTLKNEAYRLRTLIDVLESELLSE